MSNDFISINTNEATPLLLANKPKGPPRTGCLPYIPKRYILTFWAFLGFFNVYALRVCLSVAINPMAAEYHWTQPQSSIILSSFFWGYIVTQLPGGFFASYVGGKNFLTAAVFIASALTLFTPIVATKLGERGLIALRVAEGIGEGVSYPAMHAIFSRWAPLEERTFLPAIVYSGAFVGTIATFPIAAQLSTGKFLTGWPATFYVFGASGVIWCLFWQYFVASTPATHSTIAIEEREYIEASLQKETDEGQFNVPWKRIFTNMPVYALCLAQFASNWAFYTNLTLAPTYLEKCLGFDIKENGFLSTIPYIGITIVFTISGRLADFIIAKGFGVTRTRKVFQSFALLLSAASFFGIGYVDSVPAAVALLSLSTATVGFSAGGYGVNHLDIGGRLGGIMMGIANTIGTIPGIVSPIVAGQILGDEPKSPERWQIVFQISAGISVAIWLFFCIFASGQRQF